MIPWCFNCRPESRQGCLPTSQLGGPRAFSGLPHEQAQPPAMQPDTQSDMQPEEVTNMQLEMRTDMHSGMQSWQAANSNSFPEVQTEQDVTTAGTISGVVQQDGIQDVHAVGDRSSSSMSLVEAAALAASSPGAVVRVPTSTTLSQADQIALRYQHQVGSLQYMHSLEGSCCCACCCNLSLMHDTHPPPPTRERIHQCTNSKGYMQLTLFRGISDQVKCGKSSMLLH